MLSATAAAAAASSPEAGVCGGVRQENGENGSVVIRDNIGCREHCEKTPLSSNLGGDPVSSCTLVELQLGLYDLELEMLSVVIWICNYPIRIKQGSGTPTSESTKSSLQASRM